MTATSKRLPTLPETAGASGAAGSAGGRLAEAPLELCTASDRFHDYVLGAYEPLAPPEGKLRSVNLLVESFALAGVEAQGLAMIRRIREEYGPFRTIFGVKWNRETGAIGWELYFYDWNRAHADCSLPRLREILAPAVNVDAVEPWPLPWHMISVEIGPAHLVGGGPVPAHVYVDMRSYELTGERFVFENVYTFHDPRAEVDDILHRLRSSVYVEPGRHNLAALMPPPLFRCGKICVANKRTSDAIYFSRIPTAPLRWFLDRHGWPAPLQRFVSGAGAGLGHLLWDVGVDFRSARGGELSVGKTGVYGSF